MSETNAAFATELSSVLGYPSHCDFLSAPAESLPESSVPDVGGLSSAVCQFFDGCMAFVRDAAELDPDSYLLRLLFGRFGREFGATYHLTLPRTVLRSPLFYRTDEPELGRVAEIQCPGSLWGEYAALTKIQDYHAGTDFLKGIHSAFLSRQEEPIVHHLLDNASRPHTSMYVIQCMRMHFGVKYFGFDSVRDRECNIIRSHSFQGLIAQNIFQPRLLAATEGRLAFDYPPTPIFDQKLPLCLPFHAQTLKYFPDEVRNHILPTYLIDPDLTFDMGKVRVKLDDVMRQPREKRGWYLKYAGLDTARNWGSIAVEPMAVLARPKWESLRKRIQEDTLRGDPWIVQQDGSKKSKTDAYEKISTFVANDKVLGRMLMRRTTRKVHGQRDTEVCRLLP